MEFYEVSRTSLEELNKDILIVEFHNVGRNFLEVLHEIKLVVALYEVDILYLLVHCNQLYIKSLHKLVGKLPQGLRAVILHCRYWSYVLQFYFTVNILCLYFLVRFFVLFYFTGYFSKEEPYVR